MKRITDYLDNWKHIALVLGALAFTAVVAIFVPDSRWEHLGSALAHLAADPAGATEICGVLGTLAATFWAAWKRVPPTVTATRTASTAQPAAEASTTKAGTTTATTALDPEDTVPTGSRRRQGYARVDPMVLIATLAFLYSFVCDVLRFMAHH